MNRLILKYAGYRTRQAYVAVDGQVVKFDKKGECAFETEKQAVMVRVFSVLEAASPSYYLWSLLYFFVSFFGIFDSYRDFKCRRLEAEFIVRLSGETRVTMRNRAFNKKGESEAVSIECDGGCEVVKNTQFVDKAARRRTLVMTAVRTILFAGAVALAVVLITIG